MAEILNQPTVPTPPIARWYANLNLETPVKEETRAKWQGSREMPAPASVRDPNGDHDP
jgi:hypothetical protein